MNFTLRLNAAISGPMNLPLQRNDARHFLADQNSTRNLPNLNRLYFCSILAACVFFSFFF
jgi:hypothetical protein